jgi:hypothetical protein
MIQLMISEMDDIIVELEVLSGTVWLIKLSGFYRREYMIV